VDSGHQVTLGITWSQFPPINLSSKLPFWKTACIYPQ
jgi:hypothetical protein